MELYKVNHEMTQPTPFQINVGTNTDFYVAVGLTKDGKDATRKIMPESLTCSGDLSGTANTYINGLPCFKFSANNTASDKKLKVAIAQNNAIAKVGEDTEDFQFVHETVIPGRPEYDNYYWVAKKRIVVKPNSEQVSDGSTYSIAEPISPYTPIRADWKLKGQSTWNHIGDYEGGYKGMAFLIKKWKTDDHSSAAGPQLGYLVFTWTTLDPNHPERAGIYATGMYDQQTYKQIDEVVMEPDDRIMIQSGKPAEGEIVIGEKIDTSFNLCLNETATDKGNVDVVGMNGVYWDDILDKPDVLTPSSSEIVELDSTVSALSESFGQLDSTVSALSESFGQLDSTVSELASSLSSYATTSAMESYVDAQIGAVLSMNF